MKILSVQDVVRLTGIKHDALVRHMRAGRVPGATKIGEGARGHWAMPEDSLPVVRALAANTRRGPKTQPVAAGMKRCGHCRWIRSVGNFYKADNWCRDCRREYYRSRRKGITLKENSDED
jgi:hypothetical protein